MRRTAHVRDFESDQLGIADAHAVRLRRRARAGAVAWVATARERPPRSHLICAHRGPAEVVTESAHVPFVS
jgi:hypothetical protein